MNENPTHLDLFSGIGGFSIAAENCGFKTIGFSEISLYACEVLKKRWPGIPNYGDIKTITKDKIASVDLITGGFPCQPFSVSGKKLGDSDERFLWPELVRILGEIRPKLALFENVPGLFIIDGGRTFNRILSDLSRIGDDCIWNSVPACAIGSPQVRERIWITAYSNEVRFDDSYEKQGIYSKKHDWTSREADLQIAMSWLEHHENCELLPMDHGLSGWVDEIGCLGNSIVPQVAEIFLKEMINLL